MNEAIAKEIESRLAWHQRYVSRGFIKPHQAVAEELASLLDWCRNTPALSSPCGGRELADAWMPMGSLNILATHGTLVLAAEKGKETDTRVCIVLPEPQGEGRDDGG